MTTRSKKPTAKRTKGRTAPKVATVADAAPALSAEEAQAAWIEAGRVYEAALAEAAAVRAALEEWTRERERTGERKPLPDGFHERSAAATAALAAAGEAFEAAGIACKDAQNARPTDRAAARAYRRASADAVRSYTGAWLDWRPEITPQPDEDIPANRPHVVRTLDLPAAPVTFFAETRTALAPEMRLAWAPFTSRPVRGTLREDPAPPDDGAVWVNAVLTEGLSALRETAAQLLETEHLGSNVLTEAGDRLALELRKRLLRRVLVANGWRLHETAAALRLPDASAVRREVFRVGLGDEYEQAKQAGAVRPGRPRSL